MAEKPKTEEQAAKAISVKTTGAMRFCRAGQVFSRTAKQVTDYTPEQLAAWQAEENLIVEFI